MGRTTWIIIGIVVLFFLGFIAYSLWWPSENDSSTDKKTGKKESVEMQLEKKDCEIKRLSDLLVVSEAQLEKANEANATLTATNATLSENCGKKIVYEKAPTKAGTNKSGSGGPAGGSSKLNKKDEPGADYDVNVNSQPKSKVRIEVNEIKFCIRLGSQYWPHLAVNEGKQFAEIVDNGIGGFDLYILPSGSIGSTGKPYGIADDGTFWIEVSELADWSQFTPYFLGSKGFFEEAKRSGNYWILPIGK